MQFSVLIPILAEFVTLACGHSLQNYGLMKISQPVLYGALKNNVQAVFCPLGQYEVSLLLASSVPRGLK